MRISIATLGLITALWTSGPAWALDPIYTGYFSSTALDGYDAVAYFTEGRPAKGSSEFEAEWRGATWRFSSREHREAFQADKDFVTHDLDAKGHLGIAEIDTRPTQLIDLRANRLADLLRAERKAFFRAFTPHSKRFERLPFERNRHQGSQLLHGGCDRPRGHCIRYSEQSETLVP